MGFVANAVRSTFGGRGGGGYTAPLPPKPKLSHYSNPFLGFQTRQYELPDGNIQTVASRIYSSPQEEQAEKSLKKKLYGIYQYITAHDIIGKMGDLEKADQDYINELNRIGKESVDELNKIGGFDNLKSTLDYLEKYTTDNINSAYDRQSDILETRLSAQGLKNSTFADRQRQLLESSRHDTLNDNAYKMKLYGNQYARDDLATQMGYYEVGEEARNKQREEAQRNYENKLAEVFNPVMRAQAENEARSRLTWGERLFGESFFKPLGGRFAEITGDKIDDLLGRKKKNRAIKSLGITLQNSTDKRNQASQATRKALMSAFLGADTKVSDSYLAARLKDRPAPREMGDYFAEGVEQEVARRERQREREEILNWAEGNLARMTEKAEAHDRLMNWSANVGKPAFDKIWTDLGKDGTPSSERICKVLNDSIVPSLNRANGGSTLRAKYADYKNGIIGLTDDNGHDVLYDVFENNPDLAKNNAIARGENAVRETAVSERGYWPKLILKLILKVLTNFLK